MKKIIAATMLLSSISAFAGPYSIKFPKPLVLKGSSLINVEKIENKAGSDGKWSMSLLNTQKQNCDFAINVEGRDLALEKKAIGEHYYGSMTVSCEKTGLFGDNFKTTFSRVLILGIRQCVMSETTIDNDYCNLQVLALRKETDLSLENKDLISDRSNSRKFYRIHSQAGWKYAVDHGIIPNGVNTDLVDAAQFFNLSIGKNGNEFFIPSQNALSSFGAGRNIFLKVTDADLNRDVELRNTIEQTLKELDKEMGSITSDSKPGEAFKLKFPGVLAKFSTAVQKLLGIISPVEFFQLEKQLKGFEANLITTAKTFNPNITSRDSFKSGYEAQAANLAIMMDYLKSSKGEFEQTTSVPEVVEAGLARYKGMKTEEFNAKVTALYTGNGNYYYLREDVRFFDYYLKESISFAQLQAFLKTINITDAVAVLDSYYYYYYPAMIQKDFNAFITLYPKEGASNKAAITLHWNTLFAGK